MGVWAHLLKIWGRGGKIADVITEIHDRACPPTDGPEGAVPVWAHDLAKWVWIPADEKRHLWSFEGGTYHHNDTLDSGHWVYSRIKNTLRHGEQP